jgi:hypothetical protein
MSVPSIVDPTDSDVAYLIHGQSTAHPVFELDKEFLVRFEGQQPKWGPIGYVTYKRTYARRLANGLFEEFWQTLQRVVEGCYRLQQRYCEALRLPWIPRKAQKSAQEMYQRFWDFKCLPPGRGLWMMGTEYMDRVGGAALNNCGMVSTAEIAHSFSSPFCFLMDMSMLGVGVSFDTRGAGKIRIEKPMYGKDVHVVPDDREGWVDLVRRYLDAYSGRGALPFAVDYSQVRPAGSIIKGFGGTASGPGPLIELVEAIQANLDGLIGEKVTSEVIVDLMNLIGRCVVAGNVRRSAELALGDLNDEEYFNLKDPSELNPLVEEQHAVQTELIKMDMGLIDDIRQKALERRLEELNTLITDHPLRHHRWASNNSILAEVGMDYAKFADATAKNGTTPANTLV